MMALVESHDCSWEASGCEIRSFLVCFSYDFNAALKMTWKREEAADVEGVWDMGEVRTVDEPRMICLEVDGNKDTAAAWSSLPIRIRRSPICMSDRRADRHANGKANGFEMELISSDRNGVAI